MKMKMTHNKHRAHSGCYLRALLHMPFRTSNTEFRPGVLFVHPLRRCCGAILPPRRSFLAG
jgi:hypothetical protein